MVSGFTKSLEWAHVHGDLAHPFISVLRGKEVRRGDVLQVVCDPREGVVLVKLMREDELVDERRIDQADNLISGLHRLFLTDLRYKHMFARLCKSSEDRVKIPSEACRKYLAQSK